MSRALIPNSTQIPDVILDSWMAQLSGSEFKVLLYICRRTYGFGKEGDTISIRQIMSGIVRRDGERLDNGTGLSKETVCSALRGLEERGVVRCQRNADDLHGDTANFYSLNLEIEINFPPASQKNGHGGVRKFDTGEGKFSDTGGVRKSDTQETAVQETVTRNSNNKNSVPTSADTLFADAVSVLADELIQAGVSRSAAAELATSNPDECRLQLDYLPYAEIRGARGAYLAAAIRDGYGPPAGWEQAQAENRKKEQADRAAHARQARDEQKRRQEEDRQVQIAAARAELEADPERWEQIRKEAEGRLPVPLRGRPDRVGYQPALEANITQVIAGLKAL